MSILLRFSSFVVFRFLKRRLSFDFRPWSFSSVSTVLRLFPCEGEMMWRNKGSSSNLSRCCNKATNNIIVRVLASGIRPLWKKPITYIRRADSLWIVIFNRPSLFVHFLSGDYPSIFVHGPFLQCRRSFDFSPAKVRWCGGTRVVRLIWSRCCNKAADIIIVRVLASGIRPLWKKVSPVVEN